MEGIKGQLSNLGFLVSPQRHAPKRVMTDARDYGLGAVLLQQHEDGRWMPVAFCSRKMTDAERQYTVMEKECLAVVNRLRRWRCYLHGEKTVTVVTDHQALKWLMNLNDPRGRLARWMMEIQEFNFDVEYAPGSALVVPDPLSQDAVDKPLFQRCYRPMQHGSEEVIAAVGDVGAFGDGPSIAALRQAQIEEFGELDRVASRRGRQKYKVDGDGLLRVKKGRSMSVVVPPLLVDSVWKHVHGSKLSGHYGRRRTLDRVRGRYWWYGWEKDVCSKLHNCVPCVAAKAAKPGRDARMGMHHPSRRFEEVADDVQIISPRTGSGNTKVLVIIDTFTRFARAVEMPDERVDTIAQCLLDNWVSLFGPMERLLQKERRRWHIGPFRRILLETLRFSIVLAVLAIMWQHSRFL